MKETVTIAIPFYNAETYLASAIESVLQQTYPHFQLLLVNDGSTDRSLQIAREYAAKDSRILVLSDGQNKNLGARLNEISARCITTYLARMDADDLMLPNRIEEQLKYLMADDRIDVLGTNAYSIDEKGDKIGIRFDPKKKAAIFPVQSFIHPTIMGKTSWFQQNPYDVKAVRIEDAELWLRTAHRSGFYCLSEPLLNYREIGDRYYKKYFKAFPSLRYLLRRHGWSSVVIGFILRYLVSSARAYLYFLIGKEAQMLKKRNEIVF